MSQTPGTVNGTGTEPVIAVAHTAFADHDGLRADFAGIADLRFIDVTDPDQLPSATDGAAGIVVTLQRLSAPVIAALAPSVGVIGRAGVGLDSIDLAAAESAGIAVVNQPAYGAPEVASHALALLTAISRRLVPSDAFVRAGWSGGIDFAGIQPLDEAVVGVIGCGRIGSTFAHYVRPLVSSVIGYDPGPVPIPDFMEQVATLDELLARSTAISLHLPLVAQTRGLIGARELDLLPRGALVINVARGGIIDEDALAQALHSGQVGGAGLDVFAAEPLSADSPLHGTPNTVLTPHSASVSERSTSRLSHWTISDAVEYLRTGSVTHGSIVVNPNGNGRARPTVPA